MFGALDKSIKFSIYNAIMMGRKRAKAEKKGNSW